MTTSDQNKNQVPSDDELQQMFDAAASEDMEASPEFLARIFADAETEAVRQAQAAAAVPLGRGHDGPVDTPARASRGLLTGLLDALGGWPAIAGLSAAALAGVWIGVNPPQALADFSSDLAVYATAGDDFTTDFLPGAVGLDFDL